MSDELRPSPRYKPVSFFVTCMVDMIFPQVGISVVEILDRLGIEVKFPMGQTCCGQPAFNTGFHDDARACARRFLDAFQDAAVIVTPSGSCASMVRHFYPELFKDDPALYNRAVWAANITWELTEYLVDGLGVTDLGAALPPTTVAFHDACHGLRMMGLSEQGRKLVGSIEGVTLAELPGHDQCCGFGGTFAVKLPEISAAMLDDKVAAIQSAADVDVIACGDVSCMMQINGGLTRQGHPAKVVHIADLLAKGLKRKGG